MEAEHKTRAVGAESTASNGYEEGKAGIPDERGRYVENVELAANKMDPVTTRDAENAQDIDNPGVHQHVSDKCL